MTILLFCEFLIFFIEIFSLLVHCFGIEQTVQEVVIRCISESSWIFILCEFFHAIYESISGNEVNMKVL